MKINTDVLAKILADNISENIKIDIVDGGSGKLMAKLSVNEDYLRGVSDTIEALANMEVSVFE